MAHQGWVASLSNGETVFETEPVDGEVSAWKKLQGRLKEEELKITQMRLQKGGVTVVGLPGAEGYVQAYNLQKSLYSGKEVTVQGIGSIISSLVFMNWMNDTGQIWQAVYPLEDLKVHSSL